MNKMKQLIFIIIGFIVAALVIGGTLMSVKNDIKNQVENKQKNESSLSASSANNDIKQDMVFISITDKYNMVRRESGYIIDKNGYRYDFNFSEKGEMTHEQVLAEVNKSFDTLEGEAFISTADMSVLYNLLYSVDEKSKFDSETNESINDTTTLYGIIYKDESPSLVKIYSYGNTADNPQDLNSISIQKFISNKENKFESEKQQSELLQTN